MLLSCAMTNQHNIATSSKIKEKNGGYIVIIVLLVTAVLLMLGLSLATRTTEEVNQSGQEADTTRVFNAAETGIEAALYAIQENRVTIDPSAVTDLTETDFGGTSGTAAVEGETRADLTVTGERASDFDINIAQGEVLTLAWKSGTTVSWKYASCAVAPAVIVTLYNATPGAPTASHMAFNPMSAGGTQCADKGTGFQDAAYAMVDGMPQSRVLINDATFPGPKGAGSLLRIRPLYADGAFRVEGSSAIKLISTASDATGGTSAETRKIQVIRTEPAPPSIFDYAVFSGGSLTK